MSVVVGEERGRASSGLGCHRPKKGREGRGQLIIIGTIRKVKFHQGNTF